MKKVEEIISRMGNQNYRNTYQTNGDLDEYHSMSVSGIEEDGRIRGFVWIERKIDFSAAYIPLTHYVFGIVHDAYMHDKELETEVPKVRAGVEYLHRKGVADRISVISESPSELLIERDADGRVVFCGMHQVGLRHGLGVAFIYDANVVVQQRGIWQSGECVHVFK